MFFKKKCLKCNGENIKVVKESLFNDMKRSALNIALPIRFLTGAGKKPKNLNVCGACGFSWEDR